MLNFVNRGWWRGIAGWRDFPSSSQSAPLAGMWSFSSTRLQQCSQFPKCLAAIVPMASQAPTSCSIGDFSFANTRVLQLRQPLQCRAVSSFPQHPLGLFPSRVPSVKYFLGNNFSYTPETSVAATSLPFLALRPGVERRSSSLGILPRLSSGWSFRVLFTSI